MARNSIPTPAMSIATRAVRSSPIRFAMAGVTRPKMANIAVGTMPKTPTIEAEKPISSRISGQPRARTRSPQVEVTSADIAIAAKTSTRPLYQRAGFGSLQLSSHREIIG